MKVALLCSGVGHVQRGFERLVRDLFDGLRDDVELTLFKGGGPRHDGEQPVFNLPRHGRLLRWLPLHRLVGRTPYFLECVSFALAAWPRLVHGGFDVVHYIDIPVGQVLGPLRARRGAPFRLLYTQGVVIDPSLYPQADHVHQISAELHAGALAAGIDPGSMTLIPCGLHTERFAPPASRAELRLRHDVQRDAFVALSICALNREQKRVDALIEAFATLDAGAGARAGVGVGGPGMGAPLGRVPVLAGGPFDEQPRPGPDSLLWVDGDLEDRSLPTLGEQRLGSSFRHTRVPSAQVAELYGLADVFVLASLRESFGIAVAEAMAAGLPVLVHDNDHFRWLVPDARQRVDMTDQAALAARLAELRERPEERAALGQANRLEAAQRFDWAGLLPRFGELYRRLAGEGCAAASPQSAPIDGAGR